MSNGPSQQAADPFSNYPMLRMGLCGVAPDGSIWYYAASKMTQVAPAGTVPHPDARKTAPAATARVHDDDDDDDEPTKQKTKTHRR